MNIFFYSNNKIDNDAQSIIDYLKKAGVKVITSQASQGKQVDLAAASALIVHGTELDDNGNYFIALAISENKPVLCLLSKKSTNKTIEALQTNKNFQDKVKVIFYQPDNLQKQVLEFLQKLDSQSGQEVANIKYTLRISPKISEYLSWKTNKANRRKADWLRKILLEKMDNDAKYQNHLKNKFTAK